MITRNEQKLINRYLKEFNRESDETLIEIYNEDYKDLHPRREDEKARKKALETLLIGKI